MRRRTGILLVVAAALLIALPAGWYIGSPWWTLWQMREAARAGDMATLASYADWEGLRRGAKDEAKHAWGSMLANVEGGRDLPDSARRFVALAKRNLAALAAPGTNALDEGRLRQWLAELPVEKGGLWVGKDGNGRRPAIVRHGLNEFAVVDPGTRENGPVLTFRRHGLGWKLEGVRWGQQ